MWKREKVVRSFCDGFDEGFYHLSSLNVKDKDSFVVPVRRIWLIAHDLVEHPNGISRIGSIIDEAEALGGVMATRYRWGHRSVSNNPVASMLSDVNYVGEVIENLGYSKMMPVVDSLMSDDIELILKDAYVSRQTKSVLSHHMNIGVNKTFEKYGTGTGAYDMFYRIEDALNENIEEGIESFFINWNEDTLEASVSDIVW